MNYSDQKEIAQYLCRLTETDLRLWRFLKYFNQESGPYTKSQEEIGILFGIKRETVNRSMARLKNAKLLSKIRNISNHRREPSDLVAKEFPDIQTIVRCNQQRW